MTGYMQLNLLNLTLKRPLTKMDEYSKFHRSVSTTRVGDQYQVYYESGNNIIERKMNKSFKSLEEAKAAIKALDDEIAEAQ